MYMMSPEYLLPQQLSGNNHDQHTHILSTDVLHLFHNDGFSCELWLRLQGHQARQY